MTKQKDTYQHHEGGMYELICYARDKKTGEQLVVYASVNGGIPWVRSLKEFRAKFKKWNGNEQIH